MIAADVVTCVSSKRLLALRLRKDNDILPDGYIDGDLQPKA